MRSTLKAAAIAAIVLVGLTACEKPKPEITVFSGDNSIHTAAICWSADGANVVGAAGCSTTELQAIANSPEAAALTVAQGSTIGISVDSEVAEAGWQPVLVINGQSQALTSGLLHRRYWKMVYPETAGTSLMGSPLTLQVVSPGNSAQDVRGLWFVTLNASENLNNA